MMWLFKKEKDNISKKKKLKLEIASSLIGGDDSKRQIAFWKEGTPKIHETFIDFYKKGKVRKKYWNAIPITRKELCLAYDKLQDVQLKNVIAETDFENYQVYYDCFIGNFEAEFIDLLNNARDLKIKIGKVK